MKRRIGFVSNSSSSSFIIDRYNLSDAQIDLIEEHSKTNKLEEEAEERGEYSFSDAWDITVSKGYVKGWTIMDNFDMHDFLVNTVKVNPKDIQWDND